MSDGLPIESEPFPPVPTGKGSNLSVVELVRSLPLSPPSTSIKLRDLLSKVKCLYIDGFDLGIDVSTGRVWVSLRRPDGVVLDSSANLKLGSVCVVSKDGSAECVSRYGDEGAVVPVTLQSVLGTAIATVLYILLSGGTLPTSALPVLTVEAIGMFKELKPIASNIISQIGNFAVELTPASQSKIIISK